MAGFFCGALVGLLSSTLGDTGLRMFIILILSACGFVTVFMVREPSDTFNGSDSLEGQSTSISILRKLFNFFTRDTWEPFASRDFTLVFASRFLFQVSVSTMQQVFANSVKII